MQKEKMKSVGVQCIFCFILLSNLVFGENVVNNNDDIEKLKTSVLHLIKDYQSLQYHPNGNSVPKETHFDKRETGCVDEEETCAATVKSTPSLCVFIDDVKKKCKKSCNLCSEGCKDDLPSCKIAVKWNHCESSGDDLKFMQKHCRKSCNWCNEECGVSKMQNRRQMVGQMVGGISTSKGYFPWQAAIYYENSFICGGTLISSNTVLTAAHCFHYKPLDPSKVTVVLGDHNRVWDEGTEQVIPVGKVIKHGNYLSTGDDDDIALVKLNGEVTMTDYASKICLPLKDAQATPGTICHLSGWGKMFSGGNTVDILQELKLPIADRRLCKIRNKFNGHTVTEKMICAGYTDGNSFASGCHGDSGGPLQCEENGKWILYGIVSWGSPLCNGLERFTVFTRVSKYIDWISTHSK